MTCKDSHVYKDNNLFELSLTDNKCIKYGSQVLEIVEASKLHACSDCLSDNGAYAYYCKTGSSTIDCSYISYFAAAS